MWGVVSQVGVASRLTSCSPMHIFLVRTVHGGHSSSLWQVWVTVGSGRKEREREEERGGEERVRIGRERGKERREKERGEGERKEEEGEREAESKEREGEIGE